MSASAPGTLPNFRVVGFSGHRLVNDPVAIGAAIRTELERLRAATPDEWIAASSVAEGGDQLFAAEARALGLSWHAVLPLPPVEFAKDFTPAAWAAAEALLAGAEHVRVITENGTREDAYLDCGIETVNSCDVLLVVWDGDPARGKGGTGDVVWYAQSVGKAVIIIDANTQEVRRENVDPARWREDSMAGLNRLPERTGARGANPFRAPDQVFAFQQKCDYAASHGAPQFRRFIVAMVLLHVAATLIASAALAFGWHAVSVPWLKLLCLLGALTVALLLRHHHAHHRWVRCRLAAEFCRSALATWGLPRGAPVLEDLEIGEVRALTRTLHVLHTRSSLAQPVAIDAFRHAYLSERIEDQLAYYERQEARALPMFVRLKTGFWAATLLAILFTLLYAFSHTFHWEVPEWAAALFFYFLPIALPVIAAALISLISINDLQRRVARYREMQETLQDSRRRIAFCRTWNSLERIVVKTERALLQEVLEWHSLTSFAESH